MTLVTPLNDRILCKRIESVAVTEGGIFIPDLAQEKQTEVEVIAVGPGKRDDSGKVWPVGVKAGDRILIGKYNGHEITIDRETGYVLIAEHEVMGVITQASQKAGKGAAKQ